MARFLASFLFRWTLFLFFFGVVSAVFDPLNPPTQENFDPAEADPDGAIACLGPLPPFPLPILNGIDTNAFTLQELCAKPQYGGRGRGQHLGFFCWDRQEGIVAHDLSDAAEHWEQMASPRLLLYCRNRCYCADAQQTLTTQPVRVPWYYEVQIRRLEKYVINIDRWDDWDHNSWPAKAAHVNYNNLLIVTHIARQHLHDPMLGEIGPQRVAIHPNNFITCNGPLPTFPLPPPWTASHFADLHKFCAVQLSGGNREANAGGYCHRNGDLSAEVAFADEMTPRLDWTWDAFLGSAAMRFHCYQYCRCLNEPPVRTIAPLWRFLAGANIELRSTGAVYMVPTGADRSGQPAVPILVLPPPTAGGPRRAGTCGPDGRQFCPMAWPSDVLGPKPTGPPPAPTHTRPKSSAPPVNEAGVQLPTCGAECLTNRDCSAAAAGSSEPCRCVAVGEATAREKGLDPIFPKALCILVSQALASGIKGGKPGLKRREDQPVEEGATKERDILACACNATYVSAGCCESAEGMVWEDPELKLGRLSG
ncbi:MAG: hypothetical protein M1817_003077 [Caeruleum heppii]|nr:MAG: hypothetical protein M1817_003077 [Caeruleum heppii]